jgi:hypothetical protein
VTAATESKEVGSFSIIHFFVMIVIITIHGKTIILLKMEEPTLRGVSFAICEDLSNHLFS